MRTIPPALTKLPPDKKDFVFGSIHPPINLNELAGKEFEVYRVAQVKDQKQTLECTSYSTSYALEAHEGVPLSNEYIWKEICRLLNDKDPQGADLRTAAKAAQKGSIEYKDLPDWVKTASPIDRYDWTKWDASLDAKASVHRQGSYFFITQDGYPDMFDAIRAALYQYKDSKNFVVCGLEWHSSWTNLPGGIITVRDLSSGSGHAIALTGQHIIGGQPYLVNPESIGTGEGDRGYYYLGRDAINEVSSSYGALMFIDLEPEKAKYLIQNSISINDNWLVQLFKAFLNFFFPIPNTIK